MRYARLVLITCALAMLAGLACGGSDRTEKGNAEGALPGDVPALLALLKEPQKGNQSEISSALAAKGTEAVPALILAMGEGGEVQVQAEHVLQMIGKPAVPDLIAALQNENYQVRYGAIMSLGMIGPDAAEAVDPLKDQFGKAMVHERIAIMRNIGRISHGEDVVVMLKAMLRIKDLRLDALRALMEMGPDAASAAPTIISLLTDEEEQARYEAVETLEAIGPSEGVVQALAGRLSDSAARVKVRAARALGKFGEAGGPASGALAAALTDETPEFQKAVAQSLGQIAPASRQAIPALVKALSVKDPQARSKAAWALGEFGPEASSALGTLKGLADTDTYDYVRTAAKEAIAAIEGTAGVQENKEDTHQ